MNHDMAHCFEWSKGCPSECVRARLTKELNEEPWVHVYPVPWAHFKGTEECRLNKKETEE